MAFTAGEIIKVMSALARAYSHAQIPIPWTKPDIQPEIPNYDTYLDAEQITAKGQFSAGFQAKTTDADLRFIDIVIRLARLIKTSPNRGQYITALRHLLREIEGV